MVSAWPEPPSATSAAKSVGVRDGMEALAFAGTEIPQARERLTIDVCRCYVRFWHKADMLYALTNIRFWGKADSDQPLLGNLDL
jgi:hypothetical protein